MGTYVPFNLVQFEKFLTESKIPYERKIIPGSYEHMFDVPLTTKSGIEYPAVVRIYSSIELGSDVTRDVGEDALRVRVIRTDKTSEKFPKGIPAREIKYTAFRTKSAFPNLRDRVRLAFGQAMRQACPECGTLMVKRGTTSKFYGCFNYSRTDPLACRKTQSVEWVEKGVKPGEKK